MALDNAGEGFTRGILNSITSFFRQMAVRVMNHRNPVTGMIGRMMGRTVSHRISNRIDGKIRSMQGEAERRNDEKKKYVILHDKAKVVTQNGELRDYKGEELKENEYLVYQIRATKDIRVTERDGSVTLVKAGTLGGYIEKENNLSQRGNSWVHSVPDKKDIVKEIKNNISTKEEKESTIIKKGYSAVVYGNANVRDNAQIKDEARVHGSGVIKGNAIVEGKANIKGKCLVEEYAVIGESATVAGDARINKNAVARGECYISGDACVTDSARVDGKARVVDEALVRNEAKVTGHAYLGGKAILKDGAELGGDMIMTEGTMGAGEQMKEPPEEKRKPEPAVPEEKKNEVPPKQEEGPKYTIDKEDAIVVPDNDGPFLYRKYNGEQVMENERILYRIIAAREIAGSDGYETVKVEKGEKGGYIEKEENLSQKGNCWIHGEKETEYGKEAFSVAYGNAVIKDDAQLINGSCIRDEARAADRAVLKDGSIVAEHGQVYGDATIYESTVSGKAKVYENGCVSKGSIAKDTAEIYGKASVILGSVAAKNARICGNAKLKNKAAAGKDEILKGGVRNGKEAGVSMRAPSRSHIEKDGRDFLSR